jgi:hypothetical protein
MIRNLGILVEIASRCTQKGLVLFCSGFEASVASLTLPSQFTLASPVYSLY